MLTTSRMLPSQNLTIMLTTSHM